MSSTNTDVRDVPADSRGRRSLGMSITPLGLTRASAVCAIAAGVLFMGVQIGHPMLNTTSIQSTNVYIRDQIKILLSILALFGLAGMYLSQVRRNGLLGLIGWVVLTLGFLGIMSVAIMAAYVMPEAVKGNPVFVHNVIALTTARGTVHGDPGAIQTFLKVQGFAYLLGCLIFGIALFRANILARWACVLLAVSGVASAVLALMPDAFYRVLAFPNAIAMIGLGWSLWRVTRASTIIEDPAVTIPASRQSSEDASIATPAATMQSN